MPNTVGIEVIKTNPVEEPHPDVPFPREFLVINSPLPTLSRQNKSIGVGVWSCRHGRDRCIWSRL